MQFIVQTALIVATLSLFSTSVVGVVSDELWVGKDDSTLMTSLELLADSDLSEVEGQYIAPEVEMSDLEDLEELHPQVLEDWKVPIEERLPFEVRYPKLARTYVHPPVDYNRLQKIVSFALRQVKNLRAESSSDLEEDEFVHVEGHQFVKGDSPFYFAGFNSYNALQQSVDIQDRKKVDLLLKSARQRKLSVMRVLAFCDGPGLEPPGVWSGFYVPCKHVFQERPGVLNEKVFLGLDYLVYKAREEGIKLILVLTNYQQYFGGVEVYARWALGTNNLENSTVLQFFESEDIKLMYKAYITGIITRVNKLSGIKYSQDSTIMAWDLINDPRCANCPKIAFDDVVHDWVSDMSAYVAQIAPRQLITVGIIGHFGESSPSKLLHNPAPWVVCLGVDFQRLFSLKNLHFGSMNSYPYYKRYNYPDFVDCKHDCRLEWVKRSLVHHVEVSTERLNKPFIVSEFGLAGERLKRSMLFDLVYNEVVESALEGNSLGGVMFWNAGVEGDIDWDNKMIYIDGSNLYNGRPKPEVLEEDREYKTWLDQTRRKFFRREQQSECQAVKEAEYFDLFTMPPGYQNTTVKNIIKSAGSQVCELSSECSMRETNALPVIYGQYQSFLK